jgi:hypothetical protein
MKVQAKDVLRCMSHETMIEIPDISGDEGLTTYCQVGLAMLYGNDIQCIQVRVDEKNPK